MAISRRTALSASVGAGLLSSLPAWAQTPAAPGDVDWLAYGANNANTKYSPLAEINADNFNKLEVAWRFRSEALGPRPEFSWKTTPVVAKGRLYATAGSRRDVVALDATTGELLWMYREDEGERGRRAPRQGSGRGLSYWSDGAEERILYVTPGYRLISLDAKTGHRDRNFGVDGVVDLRLDFDQNLDPDTADLGLNATPAVAKNVVIVGAALSSGVMPNRRRNAKGYVRGFDVKTGKRLWTFHTIPQPGEFGRDSWIDQSQPENTGNGGVWAQIAVDEELNTVYLPVELATGDQVGIYRKGDALYGESLVAVDLYTGKRKWHFQLVHHGLWDSDIPCAPILCDIPHNGKIIKAVVQPSKQCWLYCFDRVTGKPIWPIVERKVPTDGDVPGEWYSPTQPFPTKPPAYDRQGVSPADLIDWTPDLKRKALEIASHYRYGPMYAPPTMSVLDGKWGTLQLPGTQGGTNFPGGCYDPETHKVYVFSKTSLQVAAIVRSPNFATSEFEYGRGNVAAGPQAARGGGDEDGPPGGGGGGGGRGGGGGGQPQGGPLRPGQTQVDGLPLIKPPYGRITAIDLVKGDISWQVAHGETPDNIRDHPALKGLKIPRTGQAGNIGPIVTKTLVICGDSGYFTDEKGVRGARLRAYDKATGEEKGAVFIAAPMTGSPMTYRAGGRQHVVIAIGGAGFPAEMIAFRLPRA